ncbi:YchJ family protein [Polaromonas sp. SM01]|uniref:YchJ family protein n=1 Tax=Polaromonas sp. SM01 TaxID=3085630 RepID=UPI0029828868|nr:YchJ family metal-binding protein [Polaromonas sp. SM01]MDW5444734.1 YchJ family metal-binding protein [Polaromonas sp. SM01]
MTVFQPTQPCPCGRLGPSKKPLALAHCCGRFIDDFAKTPAPDAESLMRSRYTAFVLERADYLLATWHASQRPAQIEFDPGVKWLGLDVRQHRLVDATHAEVEFVARQKSPGSPALRLHELSRFLKEREGEGTGRWYYVDGDQR